MEVTRLVRVLPLILLVSCSVPDVTAPGADDHVRGPTDAKVTLIEYGDYQCPPCSKSALAVERLLKEHPRDLRFVYRHFPTRPHRNAVPAAKAAEAAERQGKFWEMHAKLFAEQQQWYGASDPRDVFFRFARELRLDESQFREAYKSEEIERRIRDAKDSARSFAVRGAPAFFVNGDRLNRMSVGYEDLQPHVVAALNRSRGEKR